MIGISKLKEQAQLYSDTVIAVISYASLGFAIVVANSLQNFELPIWDYFFGNVYGITSMEIVLSLVIVTEVFLVLYWYYQEFVFL